MKRIISTLALVLFTTIAFCQTSENEKLIILGKFYKDFMFRNEATKEVLKNIKSETPENLKIITEFIAQTITTKNKLLTQQFLTLPSDSILKQVYIVLQINYNIRKEDQIDNNKLIDSLKHKEIPRYELVDNYYDILFTAVGNKNRPFDLSKIDFKLDNYSLKDDTEKGIMFLRCMNVCGKMIWGFMNVVKPANTKEAYAYIKMYPRFNGLPYYQFSDFYFNDFDLIIARDKGPQSYKSYYIDKYYEVLLSHLICLNKEGGTQKEKYDLLLGSILKEKSLYKYTKHKDTLENIFKEQEKD